MGWACSQARKLTHDTTEGKMSGKATRGRKKDKVIATYDGRERLWTVERFNLTQMKMETI